ncbi:tumor necrosis factor receptor superfamily member 6 isoform X1 [Canis lupus familiaris]|uniref:Tumor necrosis factor receptor superfamily member 6 n=3 Tax=Canis lupus TaxID=9612 RepID=A0A8P0SJS7_CANLF|nr:tumor necrosis factor receptor superfamily member 6 isoform X1 [Canis lupus familiaris]XP_025297236.2 tumor necrosis factor receptor superfamily member 6 isoform X2 [Canis lupus dingo]XP_038293639.1 tumor necrosis factor receptor superfamily member 6 isoform X1 [Canis lupus familiaris]
MLIKIFCSKLRVMPWTKTLASIAGPWPRGVKAQVTSLSYKVLRSGRNVTMGDVRCWEDPLHGNSLCCDACPPGTRKESDCTSYAGKSHCVPCQEGEEYTDKTHLSPKCRRCGICDGEHGLEVERNCTQTRNTKCRCKPNFYCDVSPCEHCNPCSTCEHGILERCTPTSDTKCEEGSSSRYLWFCVLIPILTSVLVCWWLFKRRRTKGNVTLGPTPSPPTEVIPINCADIDLSKYIIGIAEQMKIKQVREFVRKNGINEAKIDEIKNDNLQDTAEQKVQLLRHWYQVHGRRGAYHTLIRGLRKAHLRALAERIQETIQKDVAS